METRVIDQPTPENQASLALQCRYREIIADISISLDLTNNGVDFSLFEQNGKGGCSWLTASYVSGGATANRSIIPIVFYNI